MKQVTAKLRFGIDLSFFLKAQSTGLMSGSVWACNRSTSKGRGRFSTATTSNDEQHEAKAYFQS